VYKTVALDPAIFDTFERWSKFFALCTPAQGKFISDYPKRKWRKLVMENVEASEDFTERTLTIIEIQLQDLVNSALIYCNEEYDEPSESWTQNAARLQEDTNGKQWDAIVCTPEATSKPKLGIFPVTEHDPQDARWNSEPSVIDRNLPALGKLLHTLLRTSSEFLIIDPHFTPKLSRFLKPLLMVLEKACSSTPAKRIEYHTVVQKDQASIDIFRAGLIELGRQLRANSEITIYCWEQLPGSRKPHEREIITNRGSICIENGMDIRAGDKSKYYYLSRSQAEDSKCQCDPKSSSYDLIEIYEISKYSQAAFGWKDGKRVRVNWP